MVSVQAYTGDLKDHTHINRGCVTRKLLFFKSHFSTLGKFEPSSWHRIRAELEEGETTGLTMDVSFGGLGGG